MKFWPQVPYKNTICFKHRKLLWLENTFHAKQYCSMLISPAASFGQLMSIYYSARKRNPLISKWSLRTIRTFPNESIIYRFCEYKAYLQVDGRHRLSHYLFINKILYWLLSFNNNKAVLWRNTEYGQLLYSNIYAMHKRNKGSKLSTKTEK